MKEMLHANSYLWYTIEQYAQFLHRVEDSKNPIKCLDTDNSKSEWSCEIVNTPVGEKYFDELGLWPVQFDKLSFPIQDSESTANRGRN